MDDIEELVNFEDDEVEDELTIIDDDTAKLVLSSTKITSPIMSNYEKIGIISKRVQFLDNGYKSTIEEEIKKMGLSKSYDIAMLEFEMNKLPPYYIKRVLPNNTYELWRHEDFQYYPK